MERVTGIEPVSTAWKAVVIAFIRHPLVFEGLCAFVPQISHDARWILNKNLHKDKIFYKMARLFTAFQMVKKPKKPSKAVLLKEKFARFGTTVKNRSPEKIQPHMTRKNILITIVVLFFLIQYVQVSSVTGGISNLNLKGSSLVDEVGRLNEMTSLLADDLTEVRSYLLMPTRQYSSGVDLEDGEGGGDSASGNTIEIALFKYVSHLAQTENLKKTIEDNYNYLGAIYLDNNALILSDLAENDDTYALSVTTVDGDTVLYFYLEKETGKLYRKTVNSLEEVVAESMGNFTLETNTFLSNNLVTILATIDAVESMTADIIESFESGPVAQILEREKLGFVSEPEADGFTLYFPIVNEAGESIAQVAFDKQNMSLTLVDLRDEGNLVLQVTELNSALPPFLEKLDVLPSAQKKVIEAQLALKETFADDGFKLLLSENGLIVSESPREDEYRHYYDIALGNGTLLGSIVIEKATGVVEVVGPDGTGTTNLLFFEEGLKKKL